MLSYFHNHVVGTVHCDEDPLEENEEVSKQTEITVCLVPSDEEHLLKMEILHMIKDNLYDSSTDKEDEQANSAISQSLSPF